MNLQTILSKYFLVRKYIKSNRNSQYLLFKQFMKSPLDKGMKSSIMLQLSSNTTVQNATPMNQ